MRTSGDTYGSELRGTRLVLTLLSWAAPVFCAAPALASGDYSTPEVVESDRPSPNLDLSLAPGVGGIGPMGVANLTFETGAFQLSARTSYASKFVILGKPRVELEEYSLLAGFGIREGLKRIHAMAGVGYASITRNEPTGTSTWTGSPLHLPQEP